MNKKEDLKDIVKEGWDEAANLVDRLYPLVTKETRLKLINIYFWGKSAGLKAAEKIYNEK